MKKFPLATMVSTLLLSLALHAQDNRDEESQKKSDRPPRPGQPSKPQSPPAPRAPEPAPTQAPEPRSQAPVPHRPLVIQLGRPAKTEPRQPDKSPEPTRQSPKSKQAPQRPASPRPYQSPTYGQVHRPTNSDASRPAPASPRPRPADAPRPEDPNFRSAKAVSRHPNTPGEVRQKLQRIGVKSEPGFIVDRSEMMLSDRQHSVLPRPGRGYDNKELRSSPIPSRNFNVGVVQKHMSLVGSPGFMEHLERDGARENERGRHYWHRERGYNYSHYTDTFGFQWYGWYVGEQHFWTRNYGGRWWWYDEGYGRWCFWNDNFWWWQDPNHVNDLYCYNNDVYIPVNSADDEIEVTTVDPPETNLFKSPDGSRVVKIASESNDAFLYDLSTPPRFDPQYLASGVVDVQFSNPNTGRPMTIILKLDDGTYDLMDSNGDPYTSKRSRSINSD